MNTDNLVSMSATNAELTFSEANIHWSVAVAVERVVNSAQLVLRWFHGLGERASSVESRILGQNIPTRRPSSSGIRADSGARRNRHFDNWRSRIATKSKLYQEFS